jgi:hypothetical protein
VIDPDDLAYLRRLFDALEPFLDQLVIIGGWAYRLYWLRDEVVVPTYAPVFTADTDIAVPKGTELPADAILNRLNEAGFVEKYFGEDRPPGTHYHVEGRKSEFYAEFLTPSVRRRPDRAVDTIVFGGIVAQALRHLDILMVEPWSVGVVDFRDGAEFKVRVPNPVSYIAQKLLVLKDRKKEDRAKDVLYVHDTLELYGARLDLLNQTWRESIRPRIGGTAEEVEDLARQYFADVTDDIRRAVLVAGERKLDPETLRRRCDVGLSTCLGLQ